MGLFPGWSLAGLPACTEGAGGCPDEDSGGPTMLEPEDVTQAFDPSSVVFDNPRERWHRAFGHD